MKTAKPALKKTHTTTTTAPTTTMGSGDSKNTSSTTADTSGDIALRKLVHPLPTLATLAGVSNAQEGECVYASQQFLIEDIIEYTIGTYLMNQPAETASVSSSAPDAGKTAKVESTPGDKFDLLQVSSVQPSMIAPSSLRQASAKQCKMQTSLAASNATTTM